jgi:hypothetical protein
MSVDLERLLLKQAQDWRAIALGHQARAEAALAELARLQKVEAGRFMSDAGSALAVEALRAKTIAVGVSKR